MIAYGFVPFSHRRQGKMKKNIAIYGINKSMIYEKDEENVLNVYEQCSLNMLSEDFDSVLSGPCILFSELI